MMNTQQNQGQSICHNMESCWLVNADICWLVHAENCWLVKLNVAETSRHHFDKQDRESQL